MAPHGSLTAAQEAIGARRDYCGIRSDRRTLVINLAICLVATGVVALSLECVGAALVFFGLAGLSLRLA